MYVLTHYTTRLYWGPSNEFIAMNKIFTMKIHCNEKYAMKTMKDFD